YNEHHPPPYAPVSFAQLCETEHIMLDRDSLLRSEILSISVVTLTFQINKLSKSASENIFMTRIKSYEKTFVQ
ncbi:hypothetical protein, partial [Photobacterium indicum]|uniref:hypothetical protein n=1 Tax=Photobacterium indicum TaxID=81447 RepID=UPI003D11E02B